MLRTIGLSLFALALAGCDKPPDPAQQRVDLVELTDGVWLHTTYDMVEGYGLFPSNGMLVDAGEELVLIDGGWGETNTRQLLLRIEAEIDKPVSAVIYTHAHDDRMGGASVLETAGIQSFATDLTQALAQERGLPNREQILNPDAPPDLLRRAGLEVFYPGPGHSADNIVVYHKPSATLFGGCLIRSGFSTSMGNTADADLGNWGAAALALESRFPNIDRIIPGHGTPGDSSLLAHTAQLASAMD